MIEYIRQARGLADKEKTLRRSTDEPEGDGEPDGGEQGEKSNTGRPDSDV
jgi:hypothetical protein